jgi:hypothetical protein
MIPGEERTRKAHSLRNTRAGMTIAGATATDLTVPARFPETEGDD